MNRLAELACNPGSSHAGDSVTDVELQLLEGNHLVRHQLTEWKLKFCSLRSFLNFGLVVRIFDQTGRCAFAQRYIDLDINSIYRRLEPGKHVFITHLKVDLPLGWYALTFSLGENPVGDFSDIKSWLIACEQTSYVPFCVTENFAMEGRGYCQLPAYSFLAAAGNHDGTLEHITPFPVFPWLLGVSKYPLNQINAALHEVVPSLKPTQSKSVDGFVLNPDCQKLVLPAEHPRLHTQVGRLSGSCILTNGEAGFLLFGPYIQARPGQYQATFFVTQQTKSTLARFTADVVAGKGNVVLGRVEAGATAGLVETQIDFEVPDPGVSDLELRIWVGPEVNLEFHKVEIVSYDSDRTLLESIRSTLRWAFPVRESVVLVLVPSITWLPFAISIANEVHATFNKRSVLVFVEPHPIMMQIGELGSSLLGSIDMGEVQTVEMEQVHSIICHDFGWQAQRSELLTKFQKAAHWVYADGFRGELCDPARHTREIDLAFFFGHVASNPLGKKAICIPASSLIDSMRVIATVSNEFNPGTATAPEPENIAVIYMRYWGKGAYEMDSTQIADSMLATMHAILPIDVLVVIKNDSRVSSEVMVAFLGRLSFDGWQWLMLDDYLWSIGVDLKYSALDVPYLFLKGILASAAYHLVFDSSVGFYVAEQAISKNKTSIVLGALLLESENLQDPVKNGKYIDYILNCDAGELKPNNAGAISIIKYYAKSYLNAIVQNTSDFLIEKIFSPSETCHVISFNSNLSQANVLPADSLLILNERICAGRAISDFNLAKKQSVVADILSSPVQKRFNDATTKKFILLNEISSIDSGLHIGSSIVTKYIINKMSTFGVDIFAFANNGVEATALLELEDIDDVGLVVFNGEGSLHHDSVRCIELLKFCCAMKKKGAKVVLINSVYHANTALTACFMDVFDYISVRESISAAELRHTTTSFEVIPDISYSAFRNGIRGFAGNVSDVSSEISVIDSVRADLASKLHQFAHTNNFPYFLMGGLNYNILKRENSCYGIAQQVFPRILRSSCELRASGGCITGRFHGLIAALSAGLPVLSVSSNTPKIEGVLEDLKILNYSLLPVEWLDLPFLEQRFVAKELISTWDPDLKIAINFSIDSFIEKIDGMFEHLKF